jgi:UPF0271 protein
MSPDRHGYNGRWQSGRPGSRGPVRRIDINSDVGESFGAYTLGSDAAVMSSITSANVACGFHAGDPAVMRHTVELARQHGVAVGAHPGFPDLVGFGRRELNATPADVENLVLYQIGALAAMTTALGLRLQHVKPHGALFNMAVTDRRLADAIARAVRAFDPTLVLFGLPGSEILNAGREAGLRIASEVFADRAYEPDGSLASRRKPGSVIHDPALVLERAVRMVDERIVVALDGTAVPVHADTICVHGDTPGAATLVATLRQGLEASGIRVMALGLPTPS